MDGDFEVKNYVAMYVVLGVIFIFLALQLSGLALEEGVSQGYVAFYGNYALISVAALVLTIVLFLMVRIRWGHLLGPWWVNGLIFLAFIVYITMITTSTPGGILPVPRASVAEFQLSPGTELYTSSIIPAFLEDWLILYVLPFMMFIALGLLIENVFQWEIGRVLFITLGVLCCLTASVGYNIWVVPGFVSQHVPAYGGQTEAYIGAWLFAFPQALVYFFTGWFLPVAHALHNFIVTYGSLYQVIGGPFMIGGI